MPSRAQSAAQRLSARMYGTADIVRSYARLSGLLPSELRIQEAHPAQLRGDVLDVGVGAGRTTAVLAPSARAYVGIDFSAAMIDEARRANPGVDLRQLDMRELPRTFAGRRFDAILLSFNTLDYIGWDDRNTLLAGLRGLLAAEGLLVFSTHSLDEGVAVSPLLDLSSWAASLRPHRGQPLAAARAVLATLVATGTEVLNRIRHRRHEERGDGYAFINDSAHGHATVTCYVTDRRQRECLAAAGYEVLARFPQHVGSTSAWHYYVCRASDVTDR